MTTPLKGMDAVTEAACHRCGRAAPVDEVRPVSTFIKLLAAFSLGAVHMGTWMWTILSENYCASCRRRLSIFSVLGATAMLSLIAYGFSWMIRKGFLLRHGMK